MFKYKNKKCRGKIYKDMKRETINFRLAPLRSDGVESPDTHKNHIETLCSSSLGKH